MAVFGGLIAGIAFVVFMVVLLAVEQHDKDKREREGLPPRKYGDITDHDVTIVYTVRDKKD